ncbi:MFS general substrate transporter [Thozetella sp. PMI_491]|nr:MFS general substrate transporter [Thozetella sp. PMI_491]
MEKAGVTTAEDSAKAQRVDKHGFLLSPQPTSRRDDPLNWSRPLKVAICLQMAFLALLGPMASAVINPAFVPLGKAFGLTPVQASYELTVFLIFGGCGPFLLVPFAHVYGRRPLVLAGGLLAAVTNIAAGYCDNWTGVMVTRAVNGCATGITIALGPPVICDVFFLHERGFYMGIFALFLNNGPHLAPLFGGFIAQNMGWKWCFIIPGFIQLGVWFTTLFCLPETLFIRGSEQSALGAKEKTFAHLLLISGRHGDRKISAKDWLAPLYMMKYICVLVPSIYYMTCLAYGSVLFATSGSVVYSRYYGFDTIKTGLILSIPLIIGNIIGEATAGWFVDWLMYRHAKRHGGELVPESRLDALWLALFLPIGTIINGVCISHSESSSWAGNAIGMAVANLGFQVATTVVYTYCTDCYKPQSAEVSAVLNLARHIFSALVSFYALPLAEEIGFEYAWLAFAFINIALLAPLAFLRVRGKSIRESSWQKPPSFHRDI